MLKDLVTSRRPAHRPRPAQVPAGTAGHRIRLRSPRGQQGLVKLDGEDASIAERFPGALIAFDTYPRRTFGAQHRMAAKRGIPARWEWACDDPRSLERLGLRMVESASITRPPQRLRTQLAPRYRYLLPLADPLFGKALRLNLFEAPRR